MKKCFKVDVERRDDKDQPGDPFFDLDPVEVVVEISCVKTGKSGKATVTVPACFMSVFNFMTQKIDRLLLERKFFMILLLILTGMIVYLMCYTI